MEVQPVRLFSLGGAEAPADLRSDFACLEGVPAPALQALWQVLGPSLKEALAPETEQLLDLFCAAYKVDADDLGRGIKACRFLIRAAAQLDAPEGALAEDLVRLGVADAVKETLIAGYAPARAALRDEIVRGAIVDHGRLLVGVKWRLDAMHASDRGGKLHTAMATLTLHYREGDDAGRITLQALPDVLGELQQVCATILSSTED